MYTFVVPSLVVIKKWWPSLCHCIAACVVLIITVFLPRGFACFVIWGWAYNMSDMSNAGSCLWSHSTHHHSVFLEVIFDTPLSGVGSRNSHTPRNIWTLICWARTLLSETSGSSLSLLIVRVDRQTSPPCSECRVLTRLHELPRGWVPRLLAAWPLRFPKSPSVWYSRMMENRVVIGWFIQPVAMPHNWRTIENRYIPVQRV